MDAVADAVVVAAPRIGNRFQPGVSGNPGGRPKKRTLDVALREMTDPDEMARLLLAEARGVGVDKLKAIRYVYDRLVGAPRQTVSIERDDDDPGVLLMRQLWQAFSNGAVGLQEGAQPPAWIEAEYAASPLPDPSSAPAQSADP